MENNEKDIIDQALKFVNENNKVAMKNLTQNSVSMSNFYKLSSEPGLPSDVDKETHDLDEISVPPAPTDPRVRELHEKIFGKSNTENSGKKRREKLTEHKDRLSIWLKMLIDYGQDVQAKAIASFPEIEQSEEEIKKMTPEQRAKLLDRNLAPNIQTKNTKLLNTNLGKS
jgi:hypothetical protein